MVSSINRLAQNRKYFLRQRRKAGPAPLPVDATIEGLTMTTEEQLREKLRKIQALFEGATTIGERHAAAASSECLIWISEWCGASSVKRMVFITRPSMGLTKRRILILRPTIPAGCRSRESVARASSVTHARARPNTAPPKS